MKTFVRNALAFGLLIPTLAHSMSSPTDMAEKVDAAAIWQGFEFEWRAHPHRAGRLGNWITQSRTGNNINVQLHQSAASGTARDIGLYTSHYSLIASPNFKTVSGNVSFQFNGPQRLPGAQLPLTPQELTVFQFNQIVNVTLDPATSDPLELAVVMSGFDLQRNDEMDAKSQKLSLLDINLSEPVLTSSTTAQFQITGQLRMSCISFECLAEPPVDYSLNIPFLVLYGDQSRFYSEQLNPVETVAVQTYNQPQPATPNISVPITLQNPASSQDLPNAVYGMSGIRIEATKPYDPATPDPTPHIKTLDLFLKRDQMNLTGNLYFSDATTVLNLPHSVTTRMISRPVALLTDFAFETQCTWSGHHAFANQAGGTTEVNLPGRIDALYYLLNGKTWPGQIETPLLGNTLVTEATECIDNDSYIKAK